jgi:hypothetical protein
VAEPPVAPQVDEHVDLNFCRNAIASLAAHTTASGSSPFTWKIGAWIIFATSVGYGVNRPSCGGGGEPDLVVHDHVDRPAGPPERQLGQVQRLEHHALPVNAASPWSRIGTTLLWSLSPRIFCLPGRSPRRPG